jgi:hypothetical protein
MYVIKSLVIYFYFQYIYKKKCRVLTSGDLDVDSHLKYMDKKF